MFLLLGPWLSVPAKQPSFFARCLRLQIEARQRRADRIVARYLAHQAVDKPTDDSERQTVRLLVDVWK